MNISRRKIIAATAIAPIATATVPFINFASAQTTPTRDQPDCISSKLARHFEKLDEAINDMSTAADLLEVAERAEFGGNKSSGVSEATFKLHATFDKETIAREAIVDFPAITNADRKAIAAHLRHIVSYDQITDNEIDALINRIDG